LSASLSPGNFGRDEQDWFGSRDQEAEEAASKSLAATAARIVGAKPFPVAAKRLEELTRTNSARIEQVVSVLESDPALSARLLRLVNSAGYGLKVRCTSVRHAAVLVGTRRLNQVATTAAILDLFESSNSLAAELLEHAAVVGSLCRYLAVHLGLPHDELFTCGFLHDIGKIMLLDTERDVYPGLLREFGGNADSVHEQERRVFGFDHATLGAHVLTAWNIPEPVPKVIAWHHQPARALQDSLLSAMVQTLRLADLLAYELGRRQDEEGVQLVAQSEAAQYLDISEPQLAAMWHDLAGLRDRSKARSHGEPELEAADPRLEVPQSLRPRGSISPRGVKNSLAPTRGSIMPTELDGPGSMRPTGEQANKDVPDKLACVVCGTGSYGNLCQACGGHVCPSHQTKADEWCSLCEDEFVEFKTTYRLPPSALTGAAAVVIVSLLGSFLSAWSSGNTGFSALLAPLLLGVIWAVVLPIGTKLWVKLRFMRGLTPRTPPKASIYTNGEHLKPEGREQISTEGDGALPRMPSVVPEYDRTTMHTSVAPPIEPFAAGLLGMLPPAEAAARSNSEPPASSRAPMVIRVDVPNFTPAVASISPRGESTFPTADGQLSAMARLAQRDFEGRGEHEGDEERGHVSSVMPTAAAAHTAVPALKTPVSMLPSDTPEVSSRMSTLSQLPADVPAVLVPSLSPAASSMVPATPSVTPVAPSMTPVAPSMTPVAPIASPEPASEIRAVPVASPAPSLAAPAPVLIAMSPAPIPSEPPPVVQKVLSMSQTSEPVRVVESSSAPPEEQSGVYLRPLNHAGVLREVCSPVVYNRCS
jgi:putative nucleotidyltransferase with HDIG domain